jgi:4-oxalocrotonate tautomerase
MPIIQVSIVSGRGPEKIEKLIGELTKVTAEVLDAPVESIKVLVTELEPTHWGSNGESIASRRARGAK